MRNEILGDRVLPGADLVIKERADIECLRHAARLSVRTLDTLHVASALELKSERFWTFDQRQEKLAQAVELKTS